VNRHPNNPVAPISRGGRSVGPPGPIRPEKLHPGAVHRDLIEAKRGDVEDVEQVALVADADIDEQVVDQHRQQHAIDHAQYVDASRLRLQIGVLRPEAQRHLNRAFALHPQVEALRLLGLELEFEQVVALTDLATGPGPGVAGIPGEAVATLAVGQIELQAVQWRIRHFQQPAPRPLGDLRPVAQIDANPVHGA